MSNRSFALVGAILASAIAVSSCTPAIVALPSTKATWLDDFTSRASTSSGVTVLARTKNFSGPPVLVGKLATPIEVRIDNRSTTPLKVTRDSFELVAGTATFRALPPDQVGIPRADLKRRELSPITLEPGESETGLLYFEPVEGRWPFLRLRTLLVDASTDALVDSVDVPFGTGHIVSCTLDQVDRQEPWSGENLLFHSCLP